MLGSCGLVELALGHAAPGAVRDWLIAASNAFERERLYLVRLTAASAFRTGFPRSFLESDHVRGLVFGTTFERIAAHRRAG